MIVNGSALLARAPIEGMVPTKQRAFGVSHGLSEAGYDLQVQQRIEWTPPDPVAALAMWDNRRDGGFEREPFLRYFHGYTVVTEPDGERTVRIGRTALASSIQRFNVPHDLWAEFRNKSTHARRFLDATIGTDGEPGWRGHLTIEAIFHGLEPLVIPAGAGLLKAVFHELMVPADYGSCDGGKYQDQPARPVAAKLEAV